MKSLKNAYRFSLKFTVLITMTVAYCSCLFTRSLNMLTLNNSKDRVWRLLAQREAGSFNRIFAIDCKANSEVPAMESGSAFASLVEAKLKNDFNFGDHNLPGRRSSI